MPGKPLEGIRVVDLTQIYQGPYAAFLMAMAGAEVVKVEPLTGERMRGAGGARTPMAFAMLNSNKKSITLDLKLEKGKELLKALAKEADVLLENFAPGTMDRLGIGWDILKEINPQLIYGCGTGFGLSGPDFDLLAMDHTIQAASGIMSVTGDADQPPGRAGGAPCDIMGGIHMYSGVLAALVGLNTTGKGTLVEISMMESMYFTLCSDFTAYHTLGELPPRNSARSPAAACPYGRYRCTDGWIAIISVAETHWQSILEVIGRTDLIGDPEFSRSTLRRKRESEVDAMIENWSSKLSRDEAYEQMRRNRIPVAPVRNLEEVRTNPHLHARGMLTYMDHPDMGEIVLPNSPMRFSDYDSSEVQFYPEVGVNNDDVYTNWLALSAEEIESLRQDHVI
ncbi:MAG: CoA transferase [Pseudomonadales bacterium]|jgi:crotonobetainyl-CoA:carnitine CoA-transferase CaiB-like acyl-CoA transferase|nr:CoA transferase [Pseudomonadales bacterium]MDP7597679.1 CoA transferase [Pseudomonadales bacterium]HJN50635.1 CoA transferase [Pseudomonadales bacterium]|tara:strand:- start:9675 stop:10859 length:1185 start_codon:yes stop_codon:yes gene_type:complete